MTLRKVLAVPCLLFLFFSGLKALDAQAVAIASVSGRIVDPQGALVSGAQVKVVSAATGERHETSTNDDGVFNFPSLQIGAYSLAVSAQGFRSYSQTGIVLQVNQHALINVSLAVGEATQTVEVHENATMVQTQENSISQAVNEQSIMDLPLNGRNPSQLMLIAGGAVGTGNQTPGQGGSGVDTNNTNTGSKSFFSSEAISVAGGQMNGTNYLMDGGDNNDTFTNVNMPYPFPDALEEFSVETSSLPARNGVHPGGVVNAVTKSGTNRLHGDLFEFVRNSDVNAWNYFATKSDGLKRNQFGGIVGGKIIRDKLFFFGGFQQSNIRQTPSASTAYVPTAAALSGNFSALDGASCQSTGVARTIVNPFTGAALPNDQINPALFDPVAVALAKYLPQSTNPCGNVTWGVPVHANEPQYIGRIDWTISAKHSLYGRYFVDKYDLAAYFNPTDILVTAVSGNAELAQSFVLGDTYTLSQSILNSFHGTFERVRNDRAPASNGINLSAVGMTNISQPASNFMEVAVSNGGFSIGCGTCSFGNWSPTTFQFADDVDVQHGKHQFAFGVDYMRTGVNSINNYYNNGSFSFNGQFSHDPLLDFLMGALSSFQQSNLWSIHEREAIPGFYLQDTYHATSRLVVNVGLRWEPLLAAHDKFNLGDDFSQGAFISGQTSIIYPNAPPGLLFYGDPGITKSFTHNDYANLSPRIGIVYNPDGAGKTTIRMGGAVLYDSPSPFIAYRNVVNPPWGSTIAESGGPYHFNNPWGSIAGGNPFPQPTPSKSVTFPLSPVQAFLPEHIHITNVGTWNLSVQHQLSPDWLVSASYLGNKTSHLWLGNEMNPAVYIPGTCAGKACSSTSNTQARRVLTLANPNYGQYYGIMVLLDDGSNANYNGLLASITHRISHNYTLLANYTWSKCLDYGDNLGPLAGEGQFEQPNNKRADYGPCGFDEKQIANISLSAKSKVGHGGLASFILSDWQIAPLFSYTTGARVNPASGVDNSLTGVDNDRPNMAAGSPYTGAGHKAALYQYLKSAQFAENATGTFGNAMHNILVAPSYVDLDAEINRGFRLSERLSVDGRVEAFDVLNHPNFYGPTASVSSSSFGRITTANNPRILQGAIKLIF